MPKEILNRHSTCRDEEEQSTRFLSQQVGYTPGTVTVDWSKKMSPAKDQAGCGSCWAHSAATAVDGNYNILTGQTLNIGPQQLVDCDIYDTG